MYISTRMPSYGTVKNFAQSQESITTLKPRTIATGISKTIVRAVKLTAIILIIGFMQVSARTNAQQKISISLKSAPLEKVFAEIEKRSGYTVFYNAEVLKYSGLVTIDMKDVTVDDILRYCLKGLPLEFSIQDKTIFIKHENHKTALEPPAGPGETGPLAVSGIVRSDAGVPLAGASVYIKKLKKTGVTNANGEFALKGVPDGEYDVEISYVGYEPFKTTITVQNHAATMTAALKQSTNKLDESVVIAYGTTTERLNTGDVSKVTSKEIERQPVTNVLEALEGRVPGLLITQTTGLPGGAFTVQIRGQNSISQGNNPFFVIDGVPYNSQLPGAPINEYLNGGSPLNFINPYDIESIEVLKDADATAIYGSRAANGAILITTKHGREGNMRFDFNVKSGLTNPARTIPILNTQQYLAMRHEAFSNDGETPGAGDHDVNGDWDTTRYTNWPKLLANKSAQFSDAEASISGGNVSTQYLIGAGYNIQKTGFPTLLPGDGGDKRGSVHFNITTASPDKKFRLVLTGGYLADKNTVQSQDFTVTSLNLAPDAPTIFNSDRSLNWAPLIPGQVGTWTNPYAQLYGTIVSNTSNLTSNAVISYAILKGLELKACLGYTNTQTNEVQLEPTTTNDPALQIASGNSTFNIMNAHSWIAEPQANYKLHLGRGTLNVLTGASFHENNMNSLNQQGVNFISDALLDDLQAAGTIYTSSNSSEYKYQAVFSRLGYNWDDKYLVNLTARRDGTSRFGPGKQFGNFGAVGAGWVFSKEDFFQKNVDFLSFGKIRASYGTTGNDQVGDYQFIDLYGATGIAYQGNQGLYPTNLSNPDLAWETTKKLEGGIELGFFKDRIMLQGSFYRNRTGNELVRTPVSAVTGFQTIASNLPALVQNTGKEFVLNTINVRTKNFTWSSAFNLTIARNKLLAFPNLASSPYASTLVIGHPITVLQLYHCIGVNDTTGLYEFASPKTGPTYNPNYLTDLNVLLDRTPKFYGGFQNSLSYKGFGLDFFFQFVKQTGLKLWSAYLMPGLMYNQPTTVLNRWQKPGDKEPYEQFTQNYGGAAANAFGNAKSSDFAYGDASFIRLKNLAFSWQMPNKWAKRAGLTACHIFIQCQNLLTITHYDGLDPETQSRNSGPRRAYTAGLQVGL